MEFYIQLIKEVTALVFLVASNTSITEVLKSISTMLVLKWPFLKFLQIKNEKSLLVAAIVSFVLGQIGGVDLVNALHLSSYVSPELGSFLTSMVVLFLSNVAYNKLLKKKDVVVLK